MLKILAFVRSSNDHNFDYEDSYLESMGLIALGLGQYTTYNLWILDNH